MVVAAVADLFVPVVIVEEDVEWMQAHKEPVVDAMVEAKKVIRSLQKRTNLDVDTIVKKSIDEANGRRYTSGNGKPDRIKCLRKEVSNGTL